MPASRAASSPDRPSSALASASKRALTRPSRSRRASRRSSAASRSVRIGKGAGMAAPPKTMPPQRPKSAPDPSPLKGGGIIDAERDQDGRCRMTLPAQIARQIAEGREAERQEYG